MMIRSLITVPKNFIQQHPVLVAMGLSVLLLTVAILRTRKLISVESWVNVILLALIPFGMGWAGIYLAAKLLTSPWEKWLFIGGFAFLVVVGIGLAIFQQYRSEKALSKEKDIAANDRRDLNTKIDNLSAQVRALLPSSLASGNTDEIRAMHTDLFAGLDRIEKAIGSLGAKFPAKVERHIPEAPATVQHIQVSQKQVPSTREDAPYGLQVILQTDVQQQPTAFMIECDGEITDGTFFMAGQAVMMGVGYGVQPDKKHFYLSVNFPPFTPESPLVITLLSKIRIRVTKVERAR